MLKFLRRERDGIIAVLLHALVSHKDALASSGLMPHQAVTMESARKMIEYFLAHGYQPTNCAAVANGIEKGKHFLLTFDDGYANNALILPLLEEYAIDAAIFVSTHNIETDEAFWWDAHYRANRKKGLSEKEIAKDRGLFKRMNPKDIAHALQERFGDDVFKPNSDLDRPLTIKELQTLAKHPRVTIGNHTHHHTLLTLCSPAEAGTEIEEAQRKLEEWTGQSPIAIAYPNGSTSPEVEAISREAGLRLGITTKRMKNNTPIAANNMHIARFAFEESTMNERTWKQCQFA